MKLTGLHFLLTYQCTFECDHCFAWGSPFQKGVMKLNEIRSYLQQAKENGHDHLDLFRGRRTVPILCHAVPGRAHGKAYGFRGGHRFECLLGHQPAGCPRRAAPFPQKSG
jgi:hypothetical protein